MVKVLERLRGRVSRQFEQTVDRRSWRTETRITLAVEVAWYSARKSVDTVKHLECFEAESVDCGSAQTRNTMAVEWPGISQEDLSRQSSTRSISRLSQLTVDNWSWRIKTRNTMTVEVAWYFT